MKKICGIVFGLVLIFLWTFNALVEFPKSDFVNIINKSGIGLLLLIIIIFYFVLKYDNKKEKNI